MAIDIPKLKLERFDGRYTKQKDEVRLQHLANLDRDGCSDEEICEVLGYAKGSLYLARKAAIRKGF